MKIKKGFIASLLFPLFILASCGVREISDTAAEKESTTDRIDETSSNEGITSQSNSNISETTTSSDITSVLSEESSDTNITEETSTEEEFSNLKNTTTSTNEQEDEYFNVIFMLDGDVYQNLSVKKGEKINKPNNPKKTGYTFVDWYSDEYFTTTFNFNNVVNDNINIYGRMDKDSYVINFYNGEELFDSQIVLSNELITNTKTPRKSGYVFKGWVENITDTVLFDMSTPIVSSLNLYALFEEESEATLSYASYEEGIYATWNESSLNNVKVEYAKAGNSLNFYDVDKSLIRLIDNNTARVDILGLTQGDYVIRVTKSDKSVVTTNEIAVEKYDRSGYAHFNYAQDGTGIDVSQGVGAYDNNGLLKSGTNVIYVTDSNKNSVTLTIGGKTYTGLVSILQAQKYSTSPLCVRIIGTINAAQYNEIKYESAEVAYKTLSSQLGTSQSKFDYNTIKGLGVNSHSNDIEKGITELNGLTTNVIYSKGEYDSYFNMCDIQDVKNVTVEGVGSDATIFQWGFTWKKCSSIEVRNLTFDAYTEDACGFEGSDDSTTILGFKTGHIWVHNNQFNSGVNNWDVCADQDKADGDGATDLKRLAFVTLSYNHYIKNHKTGLVGSGNSIHQACITLHHNYYEKCSQRMPLGRQANIHMYNNYFYSSSSYSISLRASCFGFVENCYFEGGQRPIECQKDSTYGNGYAKVYGCIFDNTRGINDGTIVSNRKDSITNTNVYGQTFDTNSSVFYYDDINQKTIATRLTTASVAKEDCKKLSGPHKDENTNQAVSTGTTESGKEDSKTETKYSVSFMDYDSVLYVEDVVNGDTISYTPSKNGYQFNGLYLDKELTKVFDKGTKITDNLVLYISFTKVDKSTYELYAPAVYKSLGLEATKVLEEDTIFETVFTLSKGVRIKNDGFSNNKLESHYNSSEDYSIVIFVDVAEGFTGNLSITVTKNRPIYIYNVNDLTNLVAGGHTKVNASNLVSGRYVIIFENESNGTLIEPKISKIQLTITK